MKRLVSGITGGVIGALVTVGGLWSLQHFQKESFKAADVYPSTLNAMPSIELGDLILDIMKPKASNKWQWNWQANSNILWQNEVGIDNEGPLRSGMVRINVMGSVAKVLKDRHKELGWSIRLREFDNMPVEYGPDAIELSPANCSGIEYDDCLFDPLPSLDRKGIRHRLACYTSISRMGEKSIHVLQSPSRSNVLMVEDFIGGSSEFSTKLSFLMGDEYSAEAACKANLDDEINQSINKSIVTVSQASPSGEYEIVAAQALDAIKKDAKGQSCTLKVAITNSGEVFHISITGNYSPLCDKAVDALRGLQFPESKVSGTTIMPLSISR